MRRLMNEFTELEMTGHTDFSAYSRRAYSAAHYSREATPAPASKTPRYTSTSPNSVHATPRGPRRTLVPYSRGGWHPIEALAKQAREGSEFHASVSGRPPSDPSSDEYE